MHAKGVCCVVLFAVCCNDNGQVFCITQEPKHDLPPLLQSSTRGLLLEGSMEGRKRSCSSAVTVCSRLLFHLLPPITPCCHVQTQGVVMKGPRRSSNALAAVGRELSEGWDIGTGRRLVKVCGYPAQTSS